MDSGPKGMSTVAAWAGAAMASAPALARTALEVRTRSREGARPLTARLPFGRHQAGARFSCGPTSEVRMLVWFAGGLLLWLFQRFVLRGYYTIGPNERAVITTFGRAQRRGKMTTLDDP